MDKRTIPLTDDQFDRLWRSKRQTDHIGEILAGSILKLAEEAAREEEKFWKTIARHAVAPSRMCSVDWVNRCIVVDPKRGSND